jgi:glycosyltransferase involved in cell wall biosynthesis
MRVLCVIENLESGGAQRQMSLLAAGLKSRGHQVELFLYNPGHDHFRPDIESIGIEIHEAARRRRSGFSLRVLEDLRSRCMQGIDAVVSFSPPANIYSACACSSLPARKIRLVCTERTSSTGPRRTVIRLLNWLAALTSDAVVANSYSEGTRLSAKPGLARKVLVIWNGYCTRRDTAGVRSAASGTVKALVVARFSAEKNGVRLLKAMNLLVERGLSCPTLSWVGAIPTESEGYRVHAELLEYVRSSPAIATRVRWLGEVRDVQALYQSADVLLLPSLYEGLPNAVCEAMLAGCPVIASHVCDHPRLLGTDGDRGLLCDPRSVDSIAGAIQRFQAMSGPERLHMISRARAFAERRLGVDRMVAAYERLLLNQPAVDDGP